MEKQQMKGNKKLILIAILLLIVVITVLILGIASKERILIGAQNKSSKVLQYYDENTVFVLFTKYLDENQTVVSPTSVQTQTVNQLDYEINIPQIDGYTPLITELSGSLDQEGMEYLESLDYVRIVQKDNIYNIYITITYDAAPSAYTVVYYEQNVDLNGYTEVRREKFGGQAGSYTGEIYTGDEVTITPEEKTGFSLNREKTKLNGKVEAFGRKTFEVYYDRVSYYLYTFNTGDSYYEPIIVKYGQSVTLSEEPTYSGYVFDGWEYSLSMDGEKITKPDTMPAYNIYAEAKWIKSDTHYTLSYYTQNADDDGYTNIGTIVVDAISGDNLKDKNQETLKTIIENGFDTVRGDTAQYYYYAEEKTILENNNFDIVIQGKGVTVVPIYFDRNVYNITLDFEDDDYSTKAEVSMGGQTYTDSYQFQVRYEGNLLEHWIKANDFTRFPKSSNRTYYFRGWKADGNSTTYVSLRLNLTSTMIEDADSDNNIIYYAQYSTSSTSRELIYLFESFDQTSSASGDTRRKYNNKFYDSAEEYRQTVYSSSTMSAKEITGVTNVGQQSSNGKYYFYYDRNILEITLYNMDNVFVKKELLYGQSMEEFVDTQLNPEDFSLETPGTKDWNFEGWYQDSNYMIPMVWTNDDGSYKTIKDNLVLYAKWSAPTYTVTFNTNGGTWTETDSRYVKVDDNTYTLTVAEGESLIRPANPSKTGNVASAWNYDVNSESVEYLFSDSQKVYSDINLDLQYVPNNNIPYMVRYIEAQYQGDVLIEDVSKYTNIVDLAPEKEVYNNLYGSTVYEYPLDIYDNNNEDNYFVVNLRHEELTLTSEDINDNVIYFLYAKNPIVPYTVYYVKYQEDAQGNPIRYDYGDIPSDDVLLGQKSSTVAAGYATEIAEDVDGWTINGSYSQTIKLTLKPSLNTMYFYYNENETGEYLVNFFFMDKNGQYPLTPNYTYTAEGPAGKILYGTDFDKFTYENGTTVNDYVGRLYDTEKSDNAYLIVTTTDEISAMDVYFKNVTDLAYTVKYVDEDGNELHDSKIIENQMYLSEVTENAIDIYGYELVVGESQEKTIQIGVNANEIVFTYKKLNNISYKVNYYEEGTTTPVSESDVVGNNEFASTININAKEIPGYRLANGESANKKLTLSSVDNNEISFYYVKRDDIKYTVEYYYDGTINEDKTVIAEATYQDVISTYTDKNITGYKFNKTENLPLTISASESNNVIKVYYVKDNFDYTVEYYYDGAIDSSKTETIEATYMDVISNYEDKNITGYRLGKTENLPLTVSASESSNVIKVYYVKDNFDYTVEYYYDGAIDSSKTETIEATYMDVISNYEDKNITGYRLDKVEGTPLTITENEVTNVIKVYYVKDNFDYTVEYYYDGAIDSSKTETIEATYMDVISNYEDKNITGYRLDKVEGTPLTITENERTNVIKVYYIKDNFDYTVEYYYDGAIDSSKTETIEATYMDVISNYEDKNITGYRLGKTENLPLTVSASESNNVIKVYYVKDNFDYTVEYYYDGAIDSSKTETIEATYMDVISNYEDKNITGYRLDKVEGTPLTITENENTNVIKVYYVKDNFDYTVEYYYDGNIDSTKTETIEATYMDVISNYEDKNITGYRLDKVEGTPLTITENENTNVIKVYYIKDNFDYKVEYYYNGTIDTNKTETIEATYMDVISNYEDKNITGYRLEKTENLPLTVTENETTNLIKIYYIVDDGNTKTLSYTVEYYKDGQMVSEDTQIVNQTVQILQPDTLTVKKDEINLTDKYIGYRLEKTNPESMPNTIANGSTIKVYYVKDNFDYTVEYYYDGAIDSSKTETIEATYMDVISNYEDKNITGYRLDKVEGTPLTITENEATNVIKVYYVKDNFDYTVEYYYDGEIDSSKTETIEATYMDVISNYEDKNITGYRLGKTENLPLTVSASESNNVIKVYYVKDNFDYTVEYYYDGAIDTNKTETIEATYMDVISNYEDKNITGYRLDRVEGTPLTITENEVTNVIKVYYVKDNFDYTVEYYYDGAIDSSKTETIEATYMDVISNYEDKNITGYRLEKTENLPLTISASESNNVIKIYYEKDNFDYTIEYYYDGELETIETETIEATYMDVISNYEDKNITGYRLDKVEGTPLTITENEEENVIKVYYVKDNFDYTVEYYYDGNIDSTKTETIEATYMDVISNYEDKNIIGYRLDKVEGTPLTIIEIEEVNVIKVYYVKDNFDYSVEYYYDEVIDSSKTETIEATYMDVISNYEDKNITGYRLDRVEGTPLTITENEVENVIKVYYVKDNFDYTVEYYYDEAIDSSKTETIEATYMDVISNYEDKNITGYRLDRVEGTPLTITENEEENVIKVYYVKDNFDYTVEFYYDGIIDSSKTEIIEATYMDVITNYSDKNIAGYRLERTENLPLTITENETTNLIKIYYIVDDGNTKTLSYTVEYYKDGQIVSGDTQKVNQTVQILQPDTLTVKKDEINLTDKYVGYRLENTDPNSIPETIAHGSTIKVYYVKDNFDYTVMYYYDEVINNSKTETIEATYMDVISNYEDKNITGYRLDRVEGTPLTITENEEENVIKVYYVKDNFNYTVEYYYDGEIDSAQKECIEATYMDVIDNYTDKNISGYKLDRVEGTPLTITEVEESNVIKVYYIKDNFDYTVEYYYDGAIDSSKTETIEATYMDVIDNYTDKNITGYALDKVDGLPLIVTESEASNVIKVYYVKAEFTYTVEYYYDGTIDASKTSVISAIYQDKIDTYTDKNITGYKLQGTENLPLTISENSSNNIIKIYYVKDNFDYTVEYYYDGNIDVARTETINAVYQDRIDTYADKNIPGYKLDKVENLPLTISEVPANNVIRVYYIKDQLGYTVKYYFDGVLDESSTENETAEFLSTIDTFEDKSKYGYRFEKTENFPLTIDSEVENNIINVYYVRKDAEAIVEYRDKYSQEKIAEDTKILGKVFDAFDVETSKKDIEGYTLIENPEQMEGNFEEDVQTKIFYYAKNTKVTVKHLEKETEAELTATEEILGYVGKAYETAQATINNYTFTESTTNTEGNMTEEEIIVTYYYAQNTKVIVNHIDQNTNEVLEKVEYLGKAGDGFIVSSKDFEGYVLLEKPEEETGIMTKEEITINYYYAKIAEGIIEKHLDINSGEILHNEVTLGNEGQEYEIIAEEFEGYDIVTNLQYYRIAIEKDPTILTDNEVESVEALLEKLGLVAEESYIPANSKGEMTVEAINVTYYYIRRTSVKVTYLYKNTNEMLPDIEEDLEVDSTEYIYGHEGEKYTAPVKSFAGYSIYQARYPENETGKMLVTTAEDGTINTQTEVVYYYVKISTGVIENHYDIKTGNLIGQSIVHKGNEEELYDLGLPEVDGYDIVRADENGNNLLPSNSAGIMTVEPITVNYYYIRKTKVIVQYVDEATGLNLIETNLETGATKDSTEIINGHEGDSYSTYPKTFNNYTLAREPEGKFGAMTVTYNEDGSAETTTYLKYYYVQVASYNPQPPVDTSSPVDTKIEQTLNKGTIKNKFNGFLNTGTAAAVLEVVGNVVIIIIAINLVRIAIIKVKIPVRKCGRHDIVKMKVNASQKTGSRMKTKSKRKKARIAKY